MGNLFSGKDKRKEEGRKDGTGSQQAAPPVLDSGNESLSDICTRLWELDINRCSPGKDYEINLQGYLTNGRTISEKDWAKRNLFSWVKEDEIFKRPTYKAFRALLDNYETETGKPEVVTPEEIQENWEFLEAILNTKVMKETHSILVARNKAPSDVKAFKKMLYSIWFDLYKRLKTDEHLDSSGFEHVFVGETRGQEVIGFHNWIQFYLQEKEGHIDYRGYFRRGTAKEESPRLVTLQFIWKDWSGKALGSSFIGTSPEFEVALYTLIFLLRPSRETNKIPVKVGPYEVDVVCYPLGKGIGTAYIIAK